jgi:eukaryotic-like serine/threonine-protein kinase
MIDRDSLPAVLRLLDQALDLTLDERRAWLARLRVDRPELAAGLEQMLAREPELDYGGFLLGGISSEIPEDTDQAAFGQGLAGRRIGAYTLERLLGHGGMGTVWLARRSDGRYEGVAAVKLLNLALLDPVGAERFRREGTVLARLDHPNIARLLDAGVTDGGQPYLVLEHVEGLPIDRYCEEHALDPPARVTLFLQVLAAVAQAHASLIVHRDLKPSNILVTADGVVKLLDFGIAKLLDPDDASADRTALTEAGGSPLTPEYAAPEQVTGGAVTTATDVYALGVVLYRLLAGVHPTAAPDDSAVQRLRALVERDPAPLAGLTGPYAADLDTIVTKTLRKEPVERYATVAAFADDLGRCLRNEPVLARPATFRYRAGKFLRRYRAPVAAGTVATVVLIGLTVVAVLQTGEARRQRQEALRQEREALQQRDQARDEERRATASNDLMNSVLQSISSSGKAFTTLELVDRGRELLERDARADPRFAARMMVQFADHYGDLAQPEREQSLLARAETLATERHDLETAAHAACRLAQSFADVGTWGDGRAPLDRAQRALARVPQARPEVRIACLAASSGLAAFERRPDTALALSRAILALADSIGDTASSRYVRVTGDAAATLAMSGRLREALALQRRCIQVLEGTGQGRTVAMADAVYGLAEFHVRLGEYRTADSLLSMALNLAGTINSGAAPMWDMIMDRADVARELGRPDSARAGYLRIRMGVRTSPDLKTMGTWLYTGLMQFEIDQRRPDLAQRYLEEAKEFFSSRPWALKRWQAAIAAAEGNAGLAHRLMREYLAEAGPPPLWLRHVPAVFGAAAEIALADGDAVEADSLARLGLRLARERGYLETESAEAGGVLMALARSRLALGDSAGARDALGRAIAGLRNGLGPRHPRALQAEAMLRAVGGRPAR